MAAAYELNSLGLAVTVLEARQRVGGRVWSRKLANGTIVEMGAEWIGPGDDTVKEMAKRLNLSLVNVGVDFLTREVINDTAVSPQQQHETIQVAAQVLATMDKTAVTHVQLLYVSLLHGRHAIAQSLGFPVLAIRRLRFTWCRHRRMKLAINRNLEFPFDLAEGSLELLDAFAEGGSDLRQPLGSKKEQDD